MSAGALPHQVQVQIHMRTQELSRCHQWLMFALTLGLPHGVVEQSVQHEPSAVMTLPVVTAVVPFQKPASSKTIDQGPLSPHWPCKHMLYCEIFLSTEVF